MRRRAPSVRARLTLWHAGVLALVTCLFSAGALLVVRARFDRLFEEQISQDLATIEKVYREETGDLGELAHRMRTTLRSEEHTSELQSPCNLVCRLLLEKKKKVKRLTYLSLTSAQDLSPVAVM